jgi:ankyrin repeat protein
MSIDEWTQAVCLHGRRGHAQLVDLLVCPDATRRFAPRHRERRLAVALREIAAQVDGTDEEIFATLQALGAAHGRADGSGRTALQLAVESGQVDVVRWLLQLPGVRGRDDRRRDVRGDTPLRIARRRGNRELVELLRGIG